MLYLANLPAELGMATALPECLLLTEYDVIVASLTFRDLWQDPNLPADEVDEREGDIDSYARELAHRHEEVLRFFKRGGVFVALLADESVLLSVSYRGERETVSASEFVVPAQSASDHMGIRRNSGTSYEILDEGVIASYLRERPHWTVTIERPALCDPGAGYPLATSLDGSTIAYEEHIGAGLLLWLPPPDTKANWHRLLLCARQLWRQRSEAAAEVALAEERALRHRLASLESSFYAERAAIAAELQQLRGARMLFLAGDATVERVRSRLQAASTYSGTKALATYHEIVEIIERQYGGERAAQTALDYGAALARRITAPANDRRYAARHPGAQPPLAVPESILAAAAEATREVVQRFVDARYREWRTEVSAAPEMLPPL